MRSKRLSSRIGTSIPKFPLKALEPSVDALDAILRSERLSAGIYFFADFAVDRTDRASRESGPAPLLRMKRSRALTRGNLNRSIGTMALIQRSGTGKSGSGTTTEPLRISASAT
jgi:hypothetical protein